MAFEHYFPTVNDDGSSEPNETATVIRNLMDGKNNGKGELELSAGTQTVLTDLRIGVESVILLMPMSAAAAAISGLWWTVTDEQATLNHSAAAGGETFRYAVIG